MLSIHVLNQMKLREVKIPPETVEELSEQIESSAAVILEKRFWLDCPCYFILIIRNHRAITIEPRRTTQTISAKALNVDKLIYL